MTCPTCGIGAAPGAVFCSGCGARLQVVCGSCRAVALPAANFCSVCGAALDIKRLADPRNALELETRFAVLQQSLPSALRDQLVAEPDGENRILTILFADLTGSVQSTALLPPEDAAALVNSVLKAMVDAVLAHGGRINRLLGDAVLAFFGTPVAHEDDPERAILAALSIRESVRALGLDVTAGVNTGEVYLGAVGSAEHQEVTAMGAAINIAARLREKALPGEILVGDATYRPTRRAFAFRPRLVQAKGFREPVRAYLVERRLPHPEKVRGVEGLRAELIGRDEELAKLRYALDELRRGRGQLVSIVGEAGVGKSRLVEDLRRLALETPEIAPRWLEGRCLDLAAAVSYWPFLDLYRACFAWTVDDDEAARARHLVGTLRQLVDEGSLSDERFREVVPVIADLLSVKLGGDWHAGLADASSEQAKQRALLAIRDVVLALARGRGLVLVLDDLHWADTLSLDAISLLMEAVTLAPLMLVCVYRPDREHRSGHLGVIAARKCADRYTEIPLRELTPQHSRRLVAALLDIQDLPVAMGDMILAKAQGNPFFVEEVVRSLIEAGVVYRVGDTWRIQSDATEVAVPESIQSVVLSRVDRLQQDVKGVLQSAAVIGRVFRRRLLALVTQQEAELERALWELEDRALIYEGRVTPEQEYSFQHQLTQDTVYHNILRRHRAVLHQHVAEALEALYGDDLAEYCEQLAHHYDRAGVSAKAIEYLVKAGEKAAGRHANQEAVRYFDRALELTGEADNREALLMGRGQAHLKLFHGEAAVRDYEELLAGARRRGDKAAEMEALLGLARACFVVSFDLAPAAWTTRTLELCEEAYVLAKGLGDKRGMARARIGTGWLVGIIAEHEEQATANVREALALSQEIGDQELALDARMIAVRFQLIETGQGEDEEAAVLAELEARQDLPRLNDLYFTQMWGCLISGDFAGCAAACDSGVAVAAALGVPPVQYPTLKALALLGLGDYGAAWTMLQAEVADDAHPFGRAMRDLGVGLYLLELAAFDRASDTFRALIPEATRLERSWLRSRAEIGLAQALVRAGRVEEAHPPSDPGRISRLVGPPTALIDAEILLARGQPREALLLAERAAAGARERRRRPYEVDALGLQVKALLESQQAEEAMPLIDDALRLAIAMDSRPRVSHLRTLRANVLAALGDVEGEARERAEASELRRQLAETIPDAELKIRFLANSAVAELTGGHAHSREMTM